MNLMQKEFLDGHVSIVKWGESLVIDSVKENGEPVANFSLLFTSLFLGLFVYTHDLRNAAHSQTGKRLLYGMTSLISVLGAIKIESLANS